MTKTIFQSLTWRMVAIALTITLGMFCVGANARDKAKCIATTQAGNKCKISVQTGSQYCHIHSPSVARCGAKTKAGTPCKHKVKNAGEKCSQHKG